MRQRRQNPIAVCVVAAVFAATLGTLLTPGANFSDAVAAFGVLGLIIAFSWVVYKLMIEER